MTDKSTKTSLSLVTWFVIIFWFFPNILSVLSLPTAEDESKYTFPTIKYATQLYDSRAENCFKLAQLNITRSHSMPWRLWRLAFWRNLMRRLQFCCRRYIPSAVFKQIECGTLPYVNEMRDMPRWSWESEHTLKSKHSKPWCQNRCSNSTWLVISCHFLIHFILDSDIWSLVTGSPM
jgi:hypothetical protein